MTAGPLALCASLAAQARPGERIEVLARRTASAMTRLDADGEAADQVADGWLVGVRSIAGGACGLAATNVLEPGSLGRALGAAREARRAAPRPWHPPPGGGPGPAAAPGDGPPAELARPGLAPLRRLAAEASEAAAAARAGRVTVTVGSTCRSVARCDSAGWSAAYAQHESQLHVRSARPGLDAVQGARIRPALAGIPVAEVIEEYLRCERHLAGPPAAAGRLDWVALSPLVVARMLSRLSQGFLRTARSPVAVGPRAAARLGSPAVTLIDDGRAEGGPAGSPFDDEGTPRRRTVLVREGVAQALLGSHEAGPTTGNATWAGWSEAVTVATTNCFLAPTGPAALADLLSRPGRGFVAEDLRGFRSGLDLASSNIEFELGGAVVRDGEQAGSARLAAAAPPGQFLRAFLQVCAGTEFYRIMGMYGGSWCLADGSLARGGPDARNGAARR